MSKKKDNSKKEIKNEKSVVEKTVIQPVKNFLIKSKKIFKSGF